jgi:NTP pyrophosphatase (non-canonical NTP hydrolase)
MIDLKLLQKEIFQNKVEKWFNTTNVDMEFNLIHWELAEAFESHHKWLWKTWEELADVAIYILWLSEMLWINLEEEIIRKVAINKARKYKKTWEWHTKV